MKLRGYQDDTFDDVKGHLRNHIRRILLYSPTGSGKTVLASFIIKGAVAKGNRVWFVVHKRELVKQTLRTLASLGIPAGVIANGWPEDSNAPVQVCSVQTLRNRYHRLKTPTIILWDECHHVAAKTWDSIFSYLSQSYHIGLTATPCRLDGKGLKKYFDVIAKGPDVGWLIDNNYLCDYRAFIPTVVDTSGVKKVAGDFKKSDLEGLVGSHITGSVIDHYKKHVNGGRMIVFAVSVEHSKAIQQAFVESGISAFHIDGKTKQSIRDKAIENFHKKEIKILTNVDIFSEGFDVPALDAVGLLRPTASLSMHLQQIGRVLRPSPGKDEAIILDHVGNCITHGLPDMKRDWSLDGIIKDQEKAISLWVCNECYFANEGGSECDNCGAMRTLKKKNKKGSSS